MDHDTNEDSPGKSLYAVLNVSPTASSEEIRRSYRGLAQTYHPDKQPSADLRAEAAAQFARIQNAHEVCSISSFQQVVVHLVQFGIQKVPAGPSGR